MLIRFGFSNFKSICNYQSLSLVATKLKDGKSNTITNSAVKETLLTSAVIYGANASGKSNLLLGLQHFLSFIRRSNKLEAGEKIPREPFKLSKKKIAEPSEFDIDFIYDGKHFEYGFVIDDDKVLEEWLFVYSISEKGRRSKSVLFERDTSGRETFYFGKNLKGRNKVIEELTKDNSLFLSTAAQNNHELLSEVYQYLRDYYDFRVNDLSNRSNAELNIKEALSNEKILKQAKTLLCEFDFGIKDISIEKVDISKKDMKIFDKLEDVLRDEIEDYDDFTSFVRESFSKELVFSHSGQDGKATQFKFHEESQGTKALLSVICPALEILDSGGVFVIDELDSSLHTLLSMNFIKLFSNPSINKKNAQLVLSTHDTNLISSKQGLFRRDQIWLTEKNENGETELFPLSDLQVNKKDNLEEGYLQGRFGGIPFFSSRDSVVDLLEVSNG